MQRKYQPFSVPNPKKEETEYSLGMNTEKLLWVSTIRKLFFRFFGKWKEDWRLRVDIEIVDNVLDNIILSLCNGLMIKFLPLTMQKRKRQREREVYKNCC